MRYFASYPKVKYNKVMLRNIMRRADLIDSVFERQDVYYPYIVHDWERPDTIAADYYDDSYLYWIVLFSNNIVDPYHEWPKDYRTFLAYMNKKYGSVNTTKSTIKHYTYTGIGGESAAQIARKSWIMPVETYNNLSAGDKSGWTATYVYDWEVDQNDSKRSIRILDKRYVPQILDEMKDILQ